MPSPMGSASGRWGDQYALTRGQMSDNEENVCAASALCLVEAAFTKAMPSAPAVLTPASRCRRKRAFVDLDRVETSALAMIAELPAARYRAPVTAQIRCDRRCGASH